MSRKRRFSEAAKTSVDVPPEVPPESPLPPAPVTERAPARPLGHFIRRTYDGDGNLVNEVSQQ